MKAIALLFLVLTACFNTQVMSMDAFSDIPLGATSSEVIISHGQPYAINKKSDGTVEYEYLEKIRGSGHVIEERHYILTIKDGKVVSKQIKQSSPPAYYYDSYEMQTTQNGGNTPAN